MRDVAIVGIGQTPVGELWDKSLRHLGYDAIRAAMADAGIERADALYVGNMLSGELSGQEHLATLIADFAGLRGIEAAKIEAACASGAAAMRVGVLAVASGMMDTVIVAGVEKMTDTLPAETTAGLAMAADQDYEAAEGATFVALNAMIMRRYMYEYGVSKADFAPFPIIAHENGMTNPNAMFHIKLTPARYEKAPAVAPPINVMDSSPICDGAAAVALMPYERAREFGQGKRLVRVAASVSVTDTLAVHDRHDPLWLEAAYISSHKAYALAGLTPNDIDFFELHDAFSIMAAMSLEASGFAPRGKALELAASGALARDGRLPINTMGGLKARGHPVGATGVYQIVEAVMQLRGEAGANQLDHAHIAMTQNIGGSGATILTHILVGEE
ncbi:MAG TPA: thiolase domain-containing protein [Anaerolineae bacterium]|nr:thiolase domain-containing protein [Caldilineae bacterium]HID33029.1 thiolase domain-containing protein [Anaerolineae bacterium]